MGYKVNRQYNNRACIYDKAVVFSRKPVNIQKCHNDTMSTRGEIRKFSRKSALRLRRLLASIDAPDMFGVCLTVPWRETFEGVEGHYRECFNRFTLNFRRSCPNGWGVFRHELQKRKMPHTHLVCGGFDSEEVDITFMWLRSLDRLEGVDMEGFIKRGVKVDKSISDDIRAYRYLVAHSSKHKRAQLGYKGRQWGVIGEKNLKYQAGDLLELSDYQWVLLNRSLRRLCARTIKKDCLPFGGKKRISKSVGAVCFAKKETIRRLLAYVKACVD